MADLSPRAWGIPVVASTSERNALFPSPGNNQRVQNLETGNFERYDGTQWVVDVARAINVMAAPFNAKGDGTTDDTAAINAAIAVFNAGGGELLFPRGTYLVTASLTPLTATGVIRGLGAGISTATEGITVFTLTANGSGIKDLSITSAITTPTSAIGVLLNGANNFLDGVSITRFYDAVVSNDNAYSWFITRSHFYNSFHAGIDITYGGAHGDQGDCTVNSTTFEQNLGTTSTAAILYAAHGGLRVQNCKMLQHDVGVDLVLGTGAETADLLISGCSVENQAVACIRLKTAGNTGSFRNVMITGNECSALSTAKGLSVTSLAAQMIQEVIVVGNRFTGTSAAGSIGLDVIDVGGMVIDGNSIGGFETGIKITAATAVGVLIGPGNKYGTEVTYPIQDLRTSNATTGAEYAAHVYRRALPSITSTVAYTNVYQVIMNDTTFHGAMIELTLDGILQGVGSFSRIVRKLLTYEASGNVTVTAVQDVAGGQTINLQFDVATTPGSVLIGIEKPAGGTSVNGSATLRCEGSVNRVVRL
jgi:hypothetical protein